MFEEVYSMPFLQPRRQDETEQLEQLISLALNDWKQAQNFFENVSDPELVDYAAFRLETTKLRYQYMLKQLRALRPKPITGRGCMN